MIGDSGDSVCSNYSGDATMGLLPRAAAASTTIHDGV